MPTPLATVAPAERCVPRYVLDRFADAAPDAPLVKLDDGTMLFEGMVSGASARRRTH